MTKPTSSIVHARVSHTRSGPVRHCFRYRVFSFLLDLDELAGIDKTKRLFSYNRFNILSFDDRDHGSGDGTPARAWLVKTLAANDIDPKKLQAQILCFPRVLGHVFNPLSVWFCWDADDLIAIVYEVHNTFGGRHAYVLPLPPGSRANDCRQTCDKAFYVSPFIELNARYAFRVRLESDRIAIAIEQNGADGTQLHATLVGRYAELSDRTILSCLAQYPLMTLKVVVGIHWEAFRVWLKGARFQGIKGSRRKRAKARSGNLA